MKSESLGTFCLCGRGWKDIYDDKNVRSGLRLKCDKGINCEVRRACKEFFKWLRTKYYFPIRVPVYLKCRSKITSIDGDTAFGTFFAPDDYLVEPYIRIATGDYNELLKERGQDDALAAILHTVSHELAHYFQWINRIQLTETGYERQANYYATLLLDEYAETRSHP